MPARLRMALMVFASLAILAAAGVIVFTRPDSPPKLGANGFAGGLRPAIPPKDFTLRDQDGRTVSLHALRGQVVVLTFISGDQLQKFGAGIFIVNLIGLGVLRELGILITAIIVAGRSGSAFTAEIGTMQINQEVDAMRTIGLDPMEILVVPRTIALIVMLIPLGFFADIVEVAGGALMASITLNISFTQFFTQFTNVYVNSTVGYHNRVFPNIFQDDLAGINLARLGGQQVK